MSKIYNHAALVLLVLLVSSSFFLSVLAKSRNPITDSEIKKKKSECYADIDSGLWGGQCKSSSIAKENCALKCLSPACYELIYESDPLEEGEKDFTRSQEFKYCMHNSRIAVCSIEGTCTHTERNTSVCFELWRYLLG